MFTASCTMKQDWQKRLTSGALSSSASRSHSCSASSVGAPPAARRASASVRVSARARCLMPSLPLVMRTIATSPFAEMMRRATTLTRLATSFTCAGSRQLTNGQAGSPNEHLLGCQSLLYSQEAGDWNHTVAPLGVHRTCTAVPKPASCPSALRAASSLQATSAASSRACRRHDAGS